MSFITRADVIYGKTEDGGNSDLLIVLMPYVKKGQFYLPEEKTYPLFRLLRDSEVRMGKTRAVLITQLWMWNRFIKAETERRIREEERQEEARSKARGRTVR